MLPQDHEVLNLNMQNNKFWVLFKVGSNNWRILMTETKILMECVEGQEPKPLLVSPEPPKGLTPDQFWDWMENLTETDYMWLRVNEDGSTTPIPQVYEGSCVTVTRHVA